GCIWSIWRQHAGILDQRWAGNDLAPRGGNSVSGETTAGPDSAPALWTIGHSTRSIRTLIDLLRQAGIELLADVRRHPWSRRHPQFTRDALAGSLQAEDIEYHWFPELGGMRKPREGSRNTGW